MKGPTTRFPQWPIFLRNDTSWDQFKAIERFSLPHFVGVPLALLPDRIPNIGLLAPQNKERSRTFPSLFLLPAPGQRAYPRRGYDRAIYEGTPWLGFE
jgi:hypothetical protein